MSKKLIKSMNSSWMLSAVCFQSQLRKSLQISISINLALHRSSSQRQESAKHTGICGMLSKKIRVIRLESTNSSVRFRRIISSSLQSPQRKSIEDFERDSEIVSATVTATPIDISNSTRIVKNTDLTLKLVSNFESLTEDSEVNDAVEFNYLRVRASEAIQ